MTVAWVVRTEGPGFFPRLSTSLVLAAGGLVLRAAQGLHAAAHEIVAYRVGGTRCNVQFIAYMGVLGLGLHLHSGIVQCPPLLMVSRRRHPRNCSCQSAADIGPLNPGVLRRVRSAATGARAAGTFHGRTQERARIHRHDRAVYFLTCWHRPSRSDSWVTGWRCGSGVVAIPRPLPVDGKVLMFSLSKALAPSKLRASACSDSMRTPRSAGPPLQPITRMDVPGHRRPAATVRLVPGLRRKGHHVSWGARASRSRARDRGIAGARRDMKKWRLRRCA